MWTISSCVAPRSAFSSGFTPSMDTISRENNSMLPVGAIIVGVIALLLCGYATITLSKVNKTLAEHDGKLSKVETAESAANAAASSAERVAKDLQTLAKQTQAG